jgi:ubiquinol oxidase
MCGDYGFRSGFGRLYQGGDAQKPASGLALVSGRDERTRSRPFLSRPPLTPPPPPPSSPPPSQGLANFNKELTSLRQTVRFGPPGPAGAAPSTPLGRAARSALTSAVDAFRSLDTRLEDAGVLSKLTPDPDPVPGGGRPTATGFTRSAADVRSRLAGLTLNDAAVWAREDERQSGPAATQAPLPVKAFYWALCWVLDALFAGRPVQRFWFLETVARMPYFAYISMLHLYESLGWWRAGAELRRVHFAEEWNELHHLQIMEALGGDARWTDRFMAAHASLFYYWACVVAYLASPDVAYAFSELVEGHAYDTYDQFLADNEAALKSIAPPRVALEYYEGADLYLFDELVTGDGAATGGVPSGGGGGNGATTTAAATPSSAPRRPHVRSLYDTFAAIRDDEGEHIRTMASCRDNSIVRDLAAKRARGRLEAGGAPRRAVGDALGGGAAREMVGAE